MAVFLSHLRRNASYFDILCCWNHTNCPYFGCQSHHRNDIRSAYRSSDQGSAKKYRPPRAPQPYRRTELRGTSAHLCPQTYSRSLLLDFCNFFSAESSDCSDRRADSGRYFYRASCRRRICSCSCGAHSKLRFFCHTYGALSVRNLKCRCHDVRPAGQCRCWTSGPVPSGS